MKYSELLSENKCTVTQPPCCAKYDRIIWTDLQDWNPTRKGGEKPFSKLGIHICPPTHLHSTQSKTKKTKAFSGVVREAVRAVSVHTSHSLPLSATRWCISDRANTWWSKQHPCKSKWALQMWIYVTVHSMRVSSLLICLFSEGIRWVPLAQQGFKTSKPIRKWIKK